MVHLCNETGGFVGMCLLVFLCLTIPLLSSVDTMQYSLPEYINGLVIKNDAFEEVFNPESAISEPFILEKSLATVPPS